MGKKCALLMGLNYNNIRRSELYGCINDMNLTRNMLIDAYGYQEENMYIFRDDFRNFNTNKGFYLTVCLVFVSSFVKLLQHSRPLIATDSATVSVLL